MDATWVVVVAVAVAATKTDEAASATILPKTEVGLEETLMAATTTLVIIEWTITRGTRETWITKEEKEIQMGATVVVVLAEVDSLRQAGMPTPSMAGFLFMTKKSDERTTTIHKQA